MYIRILSIFLSKKSKVCQYFGKKSYWKITFLFISEFLHGKGKRGRQKQDKVMQLFSPKSKAVNYLQYHVKNFSTIAVCFPSVGIG